MDRIYVKHQNKTPVHQLGLDLWRDVVLRSRRIRERLQGILLNLVHRERSGEVIDRALMRSITMVNVPPPHPPRNNYPPTYWPSALHSYPPVLNGVIHGLICCTYARYWYERTTINACATGPANGKRPALWACHDSA